MIGNACATAVVRKRVWAELNIPFGIYALFCLMSPESYRCPSLKDQARTDARALRSAAISYRADHPDCPTLATLLEANEISRGSKLTDPWDRPYRIECDGEDGIRVLSSGRDGYLGTADDVVIPAE